MASARGATRLLPLHALRPTASAAGGRLRDSRRNSAGQQLDDHGANVSRHPGRQPRPAVAGKNLHLAGEPRGEPRLLSGKPFQTGPPPLPWLGDGGQKNIRRGGFHGGYQTFFMTASLCALVNAGPRVLPPHGPLNGPEVAAAARQRIPHFARCRGPVDLV